MRRIERLRAAKGARRRATAAAGLVATGVLLVHCGGTGGRQDGPRALVPSHRITTSTALDQDPALAPDGRALAFASTRSGGFQIYVQAVVPGGDPEALTSDDGQNVQPAWSPDGRRLAYHSLRRGGLFLVGADGKGARQITTYGSQPAWSPDGEFLAFASSSLNEVGPRSTGVGPTSSIWTVRVDTGERRRLSAASAEGGSRGSPAWAPDGRWVVFVEWSDTRSRILGIPSAGGATWTIHEADDPVLDPVVTADGRSVLFTSAAGVWRVALDAIGQGMGPAERLDSPAGVPVRHLSLAPDGRGVAYAVVRAESAIWSVPVDSDGRSAGAATALTPEPGRRQAVPAFSPDGRWVAYESAPAEGGDGDVRIVSADGTGGRRVGGGGYRRVFPSWRPEGRALAWLGEREGQWTLVSSGPEPGTETIERSVTAGDLGGGRVAGPVRLSPDGLRLAVPVSRSGTANIWLLPCAQGAATPLTSDEEGATSPAWAPDGRWLAYEVLRGDDSQIEIVALDGGRALRLTDGQGRARPSSWSPDGARVAFAGRREGSWNVEWVTRDGRERQRLTSYESPALVVRDPVWSPRGDRLAYELGEVTGDVWLGELR